MTSARNPQAAHSPGQPSGQFSLRVGIAAAFLLLAIAGGCGGNSDHSEAILTTVPDHSRQPAGWTLSELPGSIREAAELSLLTSEQDGITTATVQVEDANNVSALYFELGFDAAEWVCIDSTDGDFINRENGIALTMTAGPGALQHGAVLANWDVRPGLSGSSILATYRFARIGSDAAREAHVESPRTVASVPASDRAAHFLNFNPRVSSFLWYYVNPGDYDQNGEVSITDLTPLGLHFNAEGPFAVTDARSIVDGDGNGVINIADITAIGQNFGNRIDSFALYASGDSGDYPSSNTGANGNDARLVGTRQFAAASGGGQVRKSWNEGLAVPEIGQGYYWVRPVFAGAEGTPSQLLNHLQQWHSTEVFNFNPDMSLNQLSGMDLAIVGGTPSLIMIIFDGSSADTEFLYVSAENEQGTAWGPVIPVRDGGPSQIQPSLAEVNGRPAFTWHDAESLKQLRYLRAANAAGDSWVQPVTISATNEPGKRSWLLFQDGRPVVVYTSDDNTMRICPANDADGMGWAAQPSIFATADPFRGNATLLTGGIGLAIDNETNNSWVYRFIELDGTTVTPHNPLFAFPPQVALNNNSYLGQAGGTPYLVVRRDGELKYIYSFDATGETWSTEVTIPTVAVPSSPTGCEAYGVPWIGYYDGTVLYSAHADQPQSNLWLDGPTLDLGSLPGGTLHMTRAGIHPAVCYVLASSWTIHFAVLY